MPVDPLPEPPQPKESIIRYFHINGVLYGVTLVLFEDSVYIRAGHKGNPNQFTMDVDEETVVGETQ